MSWSSTWGWAVSFVPPGAPVVQPERMVFGLAFGDYTGSTGNPIGSSLDWEVLEDTTEDGINGGSTGEEPYIAFIQDGFTFLVDATIIVIPYEPAPSVVTDITLYFTGTSPAVGPFPLTEGPSGTWTLSGAVADMTGQANGSYGSYFVVTAVGPPFHNFVVQQDGTSITYTAVD